MKTIHVAVIASLVILLGAAASCKKSSGSGTTTGIDTTKTEPADAPIKTWQEHWFDHKQLISRVYYDTSLVVYYDNDVSRTITWPFTYLKKVWDYTNATYGKLYPTAGDKRLYAIFHTGKYSGGHPSYWYDDSHDNKNAIDCGSGSATAWTAGTGNDLDLTTHEIGHIVESTTHGTRTSPAFSLWGDSKWMEIYIYDVYKGLGMEADATRWFNLVNNTTDNFPATNTQWFKNWFYPIYSKYGGTKVLTNFFQLLAENFPKDGNGTYTRSMNYGEFIHFWSGAAGTDLKTQATIAFTWPTTWETMYAQAKKDFPDIDYK